MTKPAKAVAPAQDAAATPAPEGQAGAPEIAGENPAGDAPAGDAEPSDREKELAAQVEQLTGEVDAITTERDELETKCSDLQAMVDFYESETDDEDADEPAADEQPEAADYAEVKELMLRNGLKKVWLLDSGPCFSEAHAKHVAGDDFDALPVIEAN